MNKPLIFFLSFLLLIPCICQAQRRSVQPQHWIPLIKQEKEPATPLSQMAIIYADPNGDGVYKNFLGEKTYFGGDGATYNTFTNLIDANAFAIDETNRSVGINQTTPNANAYLQISDKYIICKTFTSAGINACIDALGTEGGEVYLPEGTYAISTQVTIDYSNTTIRGAGDGTILILGADVSGIKAADDIDNIILQDFMIDGNDVDLSANNALIDIEGTENAVIDHIHFKNFEEWALYIKTDNADDDFAIVRNCIFEDSTDTSSVAIYRVSGITDEGCVHITDCEFIDCDIGIYGNSGQMIIKGCKFEDCLDSALWAVSSCTYGMLQNCIINGNAAYAVYLVNSFGWTITNNIFCDNANNEICIDAGTNHKISENIFSTPADITQQIYLTGNANHCMIIDNLFYLDADDADYHIYMANLNTNNIIAGNKFNTNVDTAAIYMTSSATNNVIYGNQNTSFAGTNRVYGDFEVYANFVHAGIDQDTIASTEDGNPATHTLAPTATYIELTCNDPDTCDITMSETGAEQGQICIITNLTANVCDFADTAGVSELAGAFAMGQYDILELIYLSDRWVERTRSDNSP